MFHVNDVWWRCSGTKNQRERYCGKSKICKNDNPKSRTASGYNTVHLLNKWRLDKDATLPINYETDQEITPIGIKYKSNKAKLIGKTPWVGQKTVAK
jgi:hypothetical protein